MKIIDLLNKIANGEEVPKKIKYKNYIYEYQHRRDTENSFNYMCNENGEYLSRRYFIDNILNDEVKVLEEKKIPEKLEELGEITYDLGFIDYKNIETLKKCLNKDFQTIYDTLDLLIKKQNQLIDYLKSKGE